MWLQKLLLVGLFIGLLQVTSILCQSTLPDYVKQQRTPYYQSKSSRELGCRAKYSDPNRATLHCLESFLEEQIHTHGSKEYKMPQTFRVGWDYHPSIKGVPADFGYKLSMRSDSYDTALTAMFLIHQNRIELARKIVDSIVFAINNDPIGDGRTRAAYYVDDNVAVETEAPIPSFFSKIFDPSVQTRALAMQANTLIRFYLHTKEYQYLKGALKIANFIEKNLWAVKSHTCGYYGGLDKDGELIGARFTADNAGIYSMAKNIYAVTKEPKWQVMEECAQKFVRNMFDQKLGTYMAQTENEKDSDEFVKDRITTDAIVWIALTDIDTEERIASALNYMMENMMTVEEQRNEYGRTKNFRGMKYSNSGAGWVGESSTGAAFALTAFADKHAGNAHSNRFKVQAKDILNSLYDAQGDAMNSDGHCLVASLRDDGAKAWYGNEFAGESFRIYPLCHSAATSWLGLYVQYTFMHDYYANPFNIYADKHIDIKDVEPYYQAPAIGYTAFEKLSIASLVIGLLLAGLSLCVIGNIVVLNLAVFGIAGASLYQNNKVTDWFKNYVKLPSDKIPLKDDDALELGGHEKTPDSPAMTDSAQETGNETRRVLPLRKAIAHRLSRLSTPASPRGSGSRPMTPVEIEHKSSSSNLVFSPNDKL